jgi:hypothetical protein
MPNVIRTSLDRILDLPVNTTDIRTGESIESTNAPNGRLYTVKNKNGTESLHDASLLEGQEMKGTPINLPLIEIEDLDNELNTLNFMEQMKKLSEEGEVEE